MNDYTCQFQFTHKKTGRKVIAQSWSDIHKMALSNDFSCGVLLGQTPYLGCSINSYDHSVQFNKFWEGARGYEKCGQVSKWSPASGVYDYIRLFLKSVRNHAAMLGDQETYIKAKKSDEWFHCNSWVFRHALPAHKN